MGKNKLSKFADMKAYPHVFEFPFKYQDEQPCTMQGHWNDAFFHNTNPIVLELGCGRGEYTVGLAEHHPDKNFIGVDIKGARMWTGATQALERGLTNVAFLRTSIEIIDRFFAPGEVSEIWITFPDPQMKRYTKRLTSTPFLVRYSRILQPDGLIHLKTDSPFLYTYTDALLTTNHMPVDVNTPDLYAAAVSETPAASEEDDGLRAARAIQTYYEGQWLSRGLTIKYIRFHLPAAPQLIEPDIEIELDTYRSYGRDKRSSLTVSK